MMIDNSPAASTGDGVLGSRPLVRNTILLILSRGVTLISGLLITAWLGRKLGPENYGIIGFATALLSYYGLVVAAGLDIAGARDIARHGARVRAIASHIFTLRLLLAGLALIGLAIFVVFLDKPGLVKLVIAIHGAWLVAIAFNLGSEPNLTY
jgi:PST family polysaccharide transporter